MSTPTRIGIFSGTFDPIHRGHVEACIVAFGALELDTVLILIEKQPHRKEAVTPYIDRANMIELATLDYPSLRMVDLETNNITTTDTIAYLEQQYPDGEYWYIVGSDMLEHIIDWDEYDKLLQSMQLCVVLRDNNELQAITEQLSQLTAKFPQLKTKILPSVWSPISSSTVKQALQSGTITTGLDPAVIEYIKRHNLYGV